MKTTLIVDGYNVLRSSGLYAEITQDDHTHEVFNAAREALISDVAVFAHRGYDAVVVFDGAGNETSTGERNDIAGISVIFSAANTTADSTIEGLAREAAAQGRNVLVITSDAATQWTVLGTRVTRMSALGFADEIRAIKKATVKEVDMVATKNTLGERLDEKTREKLHQWVRQKRL
ncbi:MAG: NYN domain-containing protein [Coriobacteriia bacterium]|jgi:predicted RNA-binding protein with PIN domain|nr:NYN domain-containing protein [Coriobacteriia bacterium]